MLKKLSKTRKPVLAVLSALVILALAMGTTFAWWTDNSKTQSVVEMGELHVEASFDDFRDLPYEPGGRATTNGTIRNTGDIPAVLRVDNACEIWFKYANDNGDPVANPGWETDSEGSVAVQLQPVDNAPYGEDGDGNLLWTWYCDKNNTDVRYLMLMPGVEMAVRLRADFSGEVMGNRYMGATVRINSELNATQTFDGAMSALFGVVYSDLQLLENMADSFVARSAVPAHILAQLEEIFHQV